MRQYYSSSLPPMLVPFPLSHRITEWWALKGTTRDHLVQPPCLSRVSWSTLLRIVSRLVLNIRNTGTSCVSVYASCLLSYCLSLLRRVWPHPFDTISPDTYTHWSDPQSLLVWTEQTSSLSLSSDERCSRPLIILVVLRWTCSWSSMYLLYWEAQNWTQYSRWGLTRAE